VTVIRKPRETPQRWGILRQEERGDRLVVLLAPLPAPTGPMPRPKPARRGRKPDLSDEQKQRGIELVLPALKKNKLTNKNAIALLRKDIPESVTSDRRLKEDIIQPARRRHQQQQ
jgi:hypothetical protein